MLDQSRTGSRFSAPLTAALSLFPGMLPVNGHARLACCCTPLAVPLAGHALHSACQDLHRIAPNTHPTVLWPMGLGEGVSGDNLCATFMPRPCVYGR